ncbi:MAG: SGNH/GDSL hydrolase family protein [Planctomycetota bacterium]|nr:SGNH/GDSL hydrolase family protein [Planctomycetota bacterium]
MSYLLAFLALLSPVESVELSWTDARALSFEGQGWSEVKSPFDRLPAKAEGVVRGAVWNLSRDSAGMCTRFVTDSTEFACRWTLIDSNLAMPHMPATGVSSVDLYVRDKDDEWRWLACPRPTQVEMTATLITGLPEGTREYMLYLPLYNGVSSCEIGVIKGSKIEPGPARSKKRSLPVVFYGTSITHGGCASRPGMPHPAILGRRLDRPIMNLGFSGNGTMDIELADLLGELDAAVYVIDCLPNMNGARVAERVVPFIKRLRTLRPKTPILLVEDRSFSNSFLQPSKQRHHAASRAALRAGYDALRKEGIRRLSYLEGAELLGNKDTVDGSHPTDLGFMRQADQFQPALEKIL